MQYSWSIMSESDYHAVREYGVLSGVSVPKRVEVDARQSGLLDTAAEGPRDR